MTKEELKELLMSVKDDPDFASVFSAVENKGPDLTSLGGPKKKPPIIIDGKDPEQNIALTKREEEIAKKTQPLRANRVTRAPQKTVRKICRCGAVEYVLQGGVLDKPDFLCNDCLG